MEGDQTLGVAFLVTKSGRDAAKMVSAIHGVAFDKKHTLSALSRADFEYALEAPEEYEEPDEEELKRVDKPLALTSNMARVMSCVAAGISAAIPLAALHGPTDPVSSSLLLQL